MEQREFVTSDLYLTSFIKIVFPQISLNLTVKNGRTLFVFTVCDDLCRAMSSFNNGLEINALEYSEMIKKLRGEIMARRTQKTVGGGG